VARKTILSWDAQDSPAELHSLLNTLEMDYPIVEGKRRGAIRLEFLPGAAKGSLEISLQKRRARIAYDRPAHAARGMGALLAGLVQEGQAHREQTPFETFGIMLDCSRNAVMTVEHFKSWLRQLALLGYNMAMLYTEDTYQLPGEPYFGYLRGRYSPEELRQIDQYAASLGIEMIGCIQTLGHLEQVLRWPAYGAVRDTRSELLVDEDATYALIEKMIAHFAQCFRSRRIHIGMDETHDLGRGRFMDRFGYQRGYDIFNRHLGKVIEICGRHGVRPMIWSDMYFRMGSKTMDYYDLACRVPDDVKRQIPPDVQLVYWDYYHDNEEFYLDWIGRHRDLGFEPPMASGVWTWGLLWHDRELTEKNAAPCVRACRKAGLKEFFFTLWGDDGGYCEFDSAMAGLTFGAELAYAGDAFDAGRLARRFRAACGADYQAACDAAGLNAFGGPMILWDDPLLGILWKARKAGDAGYWGKAAAHFEDLRAKLAPVAGKTEPLDFAHAEVLAACMSAKIQLGLELEKAYAARDAAAIKKVAAAVPRVARTIDKLLASFRRQWYRRNKPLGFETVQIRLGGLKQRYVELKARLEELAAGKIHSIPELDELPGGQAVGWTWRSVATGTLIL
jgi:hypothetical protein